MKAESTTLYFKQGSSDKVYVAKLDITDAGNWVVTFAYGRRGKPMTAGVKTKTPVSYEKAKAIYDKLIHAKELKGYNKSEDAVAYASNPNAGEDTGFRPQLLNEVTQEEAESFFIRNAGNVAVQVKWDGERRGVFLEKGKDNIFTNRKGQVKGAVREVDVACTKLIESRPLIQRLNLDTEDMGTYLVCFDMLFVHNSDIRVKTFRERAVCMEILRDIIEWENLGDNIKLEIPTFPKDIHEFRWFIEHCRVNNEEGVVIRLADAPYEEGKPNSGGPCLKLKFAGSATCVVTGHSEEKRSVSVGVTGLKAEHNGEILEIGKVTIPPNYDIPAIGALVEIKYMNIMRNEGAKLFQPRYKGLRSDKNKADIYSSLKFKKEE